MKYISFILIAAFIIWLWIMFTSCGKDKEPKKEVVYIPPNALFVINGQPIPTAYKIDTTKEWVILDSTEALKVLLKMVEDNYKRAVQVETSKRIQVGPMIDSAQMSKGK